MVSVPQHIHTIYKYGSWQQHRSVFVVLFNFVHMVRCNISLEPWPQIHILPINPTKLYNTFFRIVWVLDIRLLVRTKYNINCFCNIIKWNNTTVVVLNLARYLLISVWRLYGTFFMFLTPYNMCNELLVLPLCLGA